MKKSQLRHIIRETLEDNPFLFKRSGMDWPEQEEPEQEEKNDKANFVDFISSADSTLYHRGQNTQLVDELLKHISPENYNEIKSNLMKNYGLDDKGKSTF